MSTTTNPKTISGAPSQHQIPTERLPEHDQVEADEAEVCDGSSVASSAVSVNSAIYRGYLENGRRYQSTVDKASIIPTDDKQYEAEELTHLVFLILDSQRTNPLFRSELSKNAKYILDLGCGSAVWPISVADRFPNLKVHGVDLSPPPSDWVPPNCTLEVDDISKEWTWKNKWDLIHARYLVGAFNEAEFDALYKQAYDNLQPGGWFEQLECDVGFFCDDGTLPADSVLASHRSRFINCGLAAGRPIDWSDRMVSHIQRAGFTNIQTQDYKAPLGPWARHPVYKDAGRVKIAEVKAGLEGWTLFLLTKFGDKGTPWTLEEAQELLEKMRRDIDNPTYHVYQKQKRIWAQKPWGEEKKVDIMDIVNVGYHREHHQHYQHHHHEKHTEDPQK